MTLLMILHVTLVGTLSSTIAYEIASRRSTVPWLVLGYIAGLGTGVLLSFFLAFFLYPWLGFVAQGEDFIFRTFELFSSAALMSFLFSGVAAVVAWAGSRRQSAG